MSFKIKSNKNKQVSQVNTLNDMHTKYIHTFQQRKQSLPQKKEYLAELKQNLQILELTNKEIPKFDIIKKRSSLKTEIEKLEEEIYDIENDVTEIDYYYKTGEIIMDYYCLSDEDDDILYESNPELREKKADNDNITELSKLDIISKSKKTRQSLPKIAKSRGRKLNIINRPSIVDQLNSKAKLSENSPQNTPEIIPEIDKNVSEINDNKNNEIKLPKSSKAELYDLYMMSTDSDYACDRRRPYNVINKCSKCNVEKQLLQSDGHYVCPECADIEFVIIDSDKPNYKEAVTDTKPGYPYKRINHLNEWLAQFQAKESIDIPDKVYNDIRAELRKQRFTNLKKLSLPYMKTILKKLSLTQYYEHTTFIISKLSGNSPPTINRETEEKIRLMFRQVQVPFEKYRPKARTNFLSYSYVLHKFFQLLGLDDFVKYFPLLKSPEKLMAQDKLWEKICKDLNWDFYPSEQRLLNNDN